MCNIFSKRLKASVRMEPPRTQMQNNLYLDKKKNKFVLSDDDDSDAKFVCNSFNTPRTIVTPSSLQNNNLSSGQRSNNNNIQNDTLIRCRLPRTNNQISDFQPSLLNSTNADSNSPNQQSSIRGKEVVGMIL